MYDHLPLPLLVRRYSNLRLGTSLVGGVFGRYAFGMGL